MLTERRPALAVDLAELEASVADVTEAITLPPRCYTSSEFYAFEMEAIFAREWVCVGHQAQIPNPGDYFTVTVVDDPLLVVRGQDGEIRAMSAVCRHRGAVLAEDAGNCGRAFTCPYHSWTYDLEGTLLGAPEMTRTRGFDRRAVALPRVQVELWQGFVFVNFDPHAAPLGPRLREVEALLANYHLDQLATLPPATYEQPWNWKIMIENAMECYHCSYLHRGYHDPAPTRNLVMPPPLQHVDGVLVMRARTTHQDAAFNPTDRVLFPVIETLSAEDRHYFTWVNVLPSLIISAKHDHVRYLLMLPRGPEAMTLQVAWCFPPATLEHPRFEDLLELAKVANAPLLAQDRMVDIRVQQGMKSRFAPRGRYSFYEEHLVLFNRWLVERYRRALSGRANGRADQGE